MVYKKRYRGGITNEQFLFYEMRVTAMQIRNGRNLDQIYDAIKNGNLYQFPTERNYKRAFRTCVRRIELLNSENLVNMLSESSAEAAKQICLYAMMLDNGIVWDFMTNVIGEKYRTQDMSFSKKDVNDFLFELQGEIAEMSGWADSTIAKIKQVLIKVIVECGYLDSASSDRLNYVYLFPELEEIIRRNGMTELLPAFNMID